MRWVLVLALIVTASAQSPLPRLELTLSGWRTDPTGTVQAGIVPVDLRSDLALAREWQFAGSAFVRIAGNHRIVLQGTPYRFQGDNVLNRTVAYAGRTYTIRERIVSNAELDYAFAGHQWDFLARERGNLGWRTGVAYLRGSGLLTSASTGITAGREYTIGLPLAGLNGRVEPARFLWIDGAVTGMPLGGYGHFVQANVGGGVMFGPLGVRAGYSFIDADVHERGEPGVDRAGVALRTGGPTIGIVLRLGR